MAGWQAESATAFVSPRFGRASALGRAPKRIERYCAKDAADRIPEKAADSARRREGLGERELPNVWQEAACSTVASRQLAPLEKWAIATVARACARAS